MIDLDPQASLTIYAGLEPYEYEHTIVDVLKNPRQEIHKCINPVRDNLSIIASRIELASAESELLSRLARELILSSALSNIQEEYDYILIDCPPQLSTLTINALAKQTIWRTEVSVSLSRPSKRRRRTSIRISKYWAYWRLYTIPVPTTIRKSCKFYGKNIT